jgi:WD40 repeat protein
MHFANALRELRVLLALAFVSLAAFPAMADKRVALVVGNATYGHHAALRNVPNDAIAMAALFKAAKFDSVVVRYNLSGAELRRALRDFAGLAADADVAVLFYAGHGIELATANYLVPVDAKLATDYDVEDEAVPLDRVLQAMEPARRLRLVILDACRENPFLKSMKRTRPGRSIGRGLGRVDTTTANTLIAFATRPNDIAEDGTGSNSPFTSALVRHLLTPGLDLRIALGYVRDEVLEHTGRKQEPYVTGSLGGGIISIAGVPVPAPMPLSTADRVWAAVKETDSIAVLEEFRTRYGKGNTVYDRLAEARIAALRKAQSATVAHGQKGKPAASTAQPQPKIELVPQVAHTRYSGAKSVVFSADGRFVLSGGGDTSVRLWDAATGALLRTFAHADQVHRVAFLPDGGRLMSGPGRTTMLWDAATGKLLRTFEGSFLALSPDGQTVLLSGDNALRLWDVATGTLLRSIASAAHSSAEFSRDGRHIVLGGFKTIEVRDAGTGALLWTFVGHTSHVTAVAFSPDGGQVLTGSPDHAMKLWDAATGALIRHFEGHSFHVNSVAFSPDGRRIVSGSDSKVRLWNTATGALLRTFPVNAGVTNSVTFSPSGQRILSGDSDSWINLWDADTGSLVRTFRGRTGGVRSVRVSPDGRWLVSGNEDATLRLWDAATGAQVRTFPGHGFIVDTVAFSPDGRSVLSGDAYGILRLWDPVAGTLLRTFKGHYSENGQSATVHSVAFSPSGRQLVSGGSDNTMRLWDATTAKLLRAFPKQSDWIRGVAFSPDGRQLLSSGDYSGLKLWDAETGALLHTFAGASYAFAFSPEGKKLVSGGYELKTWDFARRALLGSVPAGRGTFSAIAFSPDGRHLLCGGVLADGVNAVELRDAATGALLRTYKGHESRVESVAFSPDGKRVVSASRDATVKVWDHATGELLVSLYAMPEDAWLALTPEGYFAGTGAAGMLNVVSGLELVRGTNRIFQTLHRPDLVQEKLARDPRGRVRDAAAKLNLATLVEN